MVQATKKCSKVFSVILIIAMLCTMLSGAVFAEQSGAANYASMNAAQAEVLAGVYECNLVMGEGMALMLYLNIDEEGRFVFSRSADFSSDEKGAGMVLAGANGDYAMVYSVVNGEAVEEGANVATFAVEEDGSLQFTSKLWFGSTTPSLTAEDGTEIYLLFAASEVEVIDEPTIVSGEYAVDTSWSSLASAYAPVLAVDAEAMTFVLTDSGNADAASISGSIAYLGMDKYQLACEDGKAIDFAYADDVITFTVAVNAAPAEGEADGELSGEYHIDLSQSIMTSFEDLVIAVDGEAMSFRIFEANEAETFLESGALVESEDAYVLACDGIEVVEGVGTAMVWVEDVVTLTSVFTAEIPEEVVAEGITDEIKFGTYGGKYTYQPGGMPMAIEYYYTMTLNEDGSYRFTSYYVVSGDKYDGVSETGTYSAQNGALVLTASDGNVMRGSIDADGNATLYRSLGSGMSGGEGTKFDITLTYGSIPAPGDSTEIAYGTYGGDHSVAAMGGTIDYAITLNLKKDGSYTYKVSFVVGGQTYTETETGSYTVDGESMRLTSSSGKVMVGKVYADGTASITRLVSSFATSAATISLKLGYTPTAGGTANPDNGDDGSDDDNNNDDNTDLSAYAGSYSGAHAVNVPVMGTNVEYSYTLVLGADGSYTYDVSFGAMGSTQSDATETGSYTVDDSGELTLTAADGTVMSGMIAGDGTITLVRKVSSKASKETEITLTAGTGEEGDDSNGDETVESVLTSGAYNVDISWSPMAAMFAPVLDVDAENMTFNVYNATDPETSKGAGTISYADGVYTLNYENGNTTTFTYADGVITFTSKLWYGTASFNSAGEDGVFVPYTAELGNIGDGEEETPGEDTADLTSGAYNVDISWSPMAAMFAPVLDVDAENMTFNVYNATDPETSKGAGTISYADGVYTLNYENGNTTTFTYADGVITFTSKLWYGTASFNSAGEDGVFVPYTAKVGASGEEEESSSYKTGLYGGKYTNVSSSGKQTDYVYTLTLNEDGSYVYTASFAMGGDIYTQTENGAYAVENGALTLTSSGLVVKNSAGEEAISSSASETLTGTIDAKGNATVNRYVSYFAAMAGSKVDLALTHGVTYTLDVEEEEASAYKTGIYAGSHDYQPSGMPMTIAYNYTLTLEESGFYSFSSNYTVSGTEYDGLSDSGAYRVENGVLTLTATDGTVVTGTINENGIVTLTRSLSTSMSGGAETQHDITLILGGSSGSDNSAEEEETPAYKIGSYGGEYSYQPSGMPMAMEYVYSMNLEDDGTYTFESSYTISGTEYTGLNETGTYTVENGTLTLTASDGSVWNGTIDANGNAALNRPLGASMSGSGYGSSFDVTLTYGYIASSGDATEDETEEEETPAYKTGSYGGSHVKEAPMGNVEYIYTLTLNEDNSYSFASSFAMGGSTYAGASESGTYTVADGVLTLSSGVTGTVDAEGNASLSGIKLSSMASTGADISLVHGVTPSFSDNGEGSDSESTDGEGTDNESAGSEGTDGEGADNESAGSEGTDGEGTDNESTGSEGTDGEGADNESAGSEGTDGEGTDNESTDSEGTDGEGTDNESTDSESAEGEDFESSAPEGEADVTV